MADKQDDSGALRERLTKLSDAALSRRLTPAECDEFYQCIAALSPQGSEPAGVGEVAIVCDWRGADPFPHFIEAEVNGRSVAFEWRDREDGMRELIIPTTPAPAQQAVTEYGWLVEKGKGLDLRYRTLDQAIPVWTPDHAKAIRFARRADAELFAEEDEEAERIVEHAWHSLPDLTNTTAQGDSDG